MLVRSKLLICNSICAQKWILRCLKSGIEISSNDDRKGKSVNNFLYFNCNELQDESKEIKISTGRQVMIYTYESVTTIIAKSRLISYSLTAYDGKTMANDFLCPLRAPIKTCALLRRVVKFATLLLVNS